MSITEKREEKNLSEKLTSKSKAKVSIGMVYFLAKFCMTPVKKAWVKKKPDNQKVGGLPSSYHFWKRNIVKQTILLYCTV